MKFCTYRICSILHSQRTRVTQDFFDFIRFEMPIFPLRVSCLYRGISENIDMSGVVPHGCDEIPRPISAEKEKTSQTFMSESTTQSDRERDSQKICRHAIQPN